MLPTFYQGCAHSSQRSQCICSHQHCRASANYQHIYSDFLHYQGILQFELLRSGVEFKVVSLSGLSHTVCEGCAIDSHSSLAISTKQDDLTPSPLSKSKYVLIECPWIKE